MKKFLLSLLLFILLLLLSQNHISATDLSDCDKDKIDSDKVNDCINILNQKLSDLGSQKKTISSQIAQFDNQIKITQLKISDAEATIGQLEKEINVLGFRIGYITDSVDKLQVLLKRRIVATYQQSNISNIEILIGSTDFSDLLQRIQYLKIIQGNDKKLLANLQQTKANYANQKDDREVKQAQIEENKKKLLGLKTSLDQQKSEKQAFLQVTKNDEARYQKLLAQVQAELAVSFGGGTETYLRDVTAGDTIGSIASYGASSGCSSGPHLHFEVHKDNSVQDPSNYLKSASFQYNYPSSQQSVYGTINPHGDLPWPINDPIYINQGFGAQKNSFIYGSSGHLGIDMQSGSGDASGETVKAVKNGKLYGGSYQCGGSYPGSLFYARIKHDDGLDTLYLHMVPH